MTRLWRSFARLSANAGGPIDILPLELCDYNPGA